MRFQIQLSNGLEITVAMHVSAYIYSQLTLPARRHVIIYSDINTTRLILDLIT